MARVILAPCPFKGTLSAEDAAMVMKEALAARRPHSEAISIPFADGGEGSLNFLKRFGPWQAKETKLPLFSKSKLAHKGIWLWHPEKQIAFLEAAQACGLALLNSGGAPPWLGSSYGVGKLLKQALTHKPREIWLAIGGTGTVDGGLGALQALFERKKQIFGADPWGGEALLKAEYRLFDFAKKPFANTPLKLLCDVQAPLKGPRGARLYMEQKGVGRKKRLGLEAALVDLMNYLAEEQNKINFVDQPGYGSGGGLAASLGMLGGEIFSGARFLAENSNLAEKLQNADLVISGEGKLDQQTCQGKGISVLGIICKEHSVPFVVFCGKVALDEKEWKQLGIDQVIPLGSPTTDGPEAGALAGKALYDGFCKWLNNSISEPYFLG